jgi:hypothetical protein
MNVSFSITIAFHLLVTLSFEIYRAAKNAVLFLCLLGGTASAANLNLAYPGYIWGNYTTISNNTSATGAVVQQGLKFGSFPLVPYVEEDYWAGTVGATPIGLYPVATFLAGVYVKLWTTPFKVGAAYANDRIQNGRYEAYVSLYKEWR